nr:putative reverse transcriptase domain-containing protein [Tanacetum cinerariifolium]
MDKLSMEEATLLESEFREDEIWEAVRGCGSDKALGPDGFNFKLGVVYCLPKGLNTIVSEAVEKGIFRGTKVGKNNVSVSHLQYANDTIFFGEWNLENVKALICILKCFEEVIGLKVNYNKIIIYGVGVNDVELGFKEGRVAEKGSFVNSGWVLEWDWVRNVSGRRWTLSEDGEFTLKDLTRLVEERMLNVDYDDQATLWNKWVPKKKEKLFAKFSKCEFWLQEVHYLRHVFNSNDVHVDSSYYRRIILDFYKIAKPLATLTQKDQKYEWGMEQEESFQTLKDNLCNAPILSLPDGPEDFVVYCDASNQGLGCVLMQRSMLIAYASRQLKIHEKNYTTRDQELVVVVFALKTWRHYLYETKSVIYTDYKSLQHIFDQKELNMRQRRWIELFSDYECEIRYHPGKANVVADALSRKEQVKPRRVQEMAMTILSRVKRMILAAQRGVQAGICESRLIGLELVQETTDKVVLIKEKLKAVRDRQKSYADNRRKSLEFEVGDQVLLKVSSWKGVIRFEKKGKLAPRYVGPFEIPEKVGLVAYRLRLPKELSSVHDIFYVSNLKKCLADANLHVPLDEIKVDKILRFVEEPVEIMDREVKSLKSKISIVKVRWNSKHGSEFTWEREDHMKARYPQLFVDRAVEPTS